MPPPRDRQRLSRWEILGAWLRLWTPPRDVDVPPIPWRAVAVGAALVAVAAVLFVVAGLPAIRDDNDESRSRAAAAQEAVAQRRFARQRAQQAPRRGRGRPARDVAGRRALVGALEAAVDRDARARARGGELRGPVRRTDCVPGAKSRQGGPPEDDPARPRGGYDCTAVTTDIAGTRASIGHPYKAVIDFRTGRLTWCKVNPPPGEQVAPDPRRVVALSPECSDPG